MSAAGCHCVDLYELDGFLCMVDHWSPRLPEILQFFHWLHCTPKLKDTAFSIAVYIQDRLEMKLGPSKPLFHSYLIAKGTKKRDAPSAARKGGE